MEKLKLTGQKRSVTGRKVKQLRKKGILPANIYGKKITSKSVQVPVKAFKDVFAKAGETGLVDLEVDGKSVPVLIHNIQYDPITDLALHADFFQVDLKEKVTAKVPVVFVGESPAVKDKVGVLLTLLTEVEVEALPADLPDKIEVETGALRALDQVIKVNDLKVGDKVKIMTDVYLDVVKVAPLVSKEAEKMAAEEAAAAATAAAQAAPQAQEGEAAAEAPSSEKPAAEPAKAPEAKEKGN